MLRKIIKIDEEKCNGCELCVNACHEGAIGMVDDKAKLLRDDYCDGLGNCLPVCPTGAISFEEKDCAAFDEKAVKEAKKEAAAPLACGCPVTHSKEIKHSENNNTKQTVSSETVSRLNQWPVQIKLVPLKAPYLEGAKLLIAADCAAYAYGAFHEDFMRDKITIIGCPKLDEGDYSEKLTAILTQNNIKSVTVVRMEVPCCAGIANAAITALKNCDKMIPWQVVTISTDGQIID